MKHYDLADVTKTEGLINGSFTWSAEQCEKEKFKQNSTKGQDLGQNGSKVLSYFWH